MKILTLMVAAAALSAQASDIAYIVGMYSAKERPGLGGHFLMKVDGKKIAKLRYPTYYRLEVPPGVYNVTMDDKDRPPILCHLAAGEICYIRARTVGIESRAEVDLISPEQAWVQLRNLIPLEKEKVYTLKIEKASAPTE
jgi:hypothetical protein